MEELLTLLEPLMEFLSPLLVWAIGIVIAVMNIIKKIDKENKAKRFYWLIGAGVSALFGAILTFIMGFQFTLFIFHFSIIYIIQLGLDLGFLKPLIKELLPLFVGVLSKTRDRKKDDRIE